MTSLDQLKKDIDEATASAFKNRFGDPIIGTYSLSFVIYNWQISVILFSAKDVDWKITNISSYLNPHIFMPLESGADVRQVLYSLFLHPLFFPLLMTISILFAMPYFLRPIYKRILALQINKENDRFAAQENYYPIARIVENLTSDLSSEKRRVDDLLSLKNSHEETVLSLKKNIESLEHANKKAIQDLEQITTATRKGSDIKIHAAIKMLEEGYMLEPFKRFAQVLTLRTKLINSFIANDQLVLEKLIELGLITKIGAPPSFTPSVGLSQIGENVYEHIVRNRL